MKRKIYSMFIILSLVTLIFLFLIYSNDVIDTVNFSISIWKDHLIPSLFPFFIVSELLINYGFIDLLGESLKGFMNKYFHLPGEASFVLIGSLISGFPSSSKYINELLDKNKINISEANYLLKFNHFSNPLFVISTVGTLILNNKNTGVLIYIVHILSNFLIAMIYRPQKCNYTHNKSSLSEGFEKMHNKRIKNNLSFSEILSNSIFNTFKTLLLLLGIITIFLIINTVINKIFAINPLSSSIISGLLEMTGGIKNIAILNIPLNVKTAIITFFLSFGGISIHMQVISILSNKNIKYFSYLKSRILHGIISSVIIYLILYFIN